MVNTGPLSQFAQKLDRAGAAMIPPPLVVRPELTDSDIDWLNRQMAVTGRPSVRYAREVPIPPLSSGRAPRSGTQTMSTQMASGYEPPSMSLLPAKPAPDTSWVAGTQVRG